MLAAEVIVSEIGLDMGRFATDRHLLSGACLCPRNDESAGKRRSNRLKKGACWLKATLIQCWATTRMKGRYLGALYHRLRCRRGPRRRAWRRPQRSLRAAYHMLKTSTPYRDLGPQHLEPRSKNALASRLLKRLAGFGYDVEIKLLAAPDPAVVSL